MELKNFLNFYYNKFNTEFHENSYPDPLMIVKKNLDFIFLDELAFICAMYAYGNTKAMIKMLDSMPFNLLLEDNFRELNFPYYRFQTKMDTFYFFKILRIIITEYGGLKKIFMEKHNEGILESIYYTQDVLNHIANKILKKKISRGLAFLIGNSDNKTNALKRFNMFLRWMVRKDDVDLGRWNLSASSLILPLDVHTFNICKKIGLLVNGSYNLKSAIKITNELKNFDSCDPIKYDFALYRIGQLNLIDTYLNIKE